MTRPRFPQTHLEAFVLDSGLVSLQWNSPLDGSRCLLAPFTLPVTATHASPFPEEGRHQFRKDDLLDSAVVRAMAGPSYGWGLVRVAFRDTEAAHDPAALLVTRWIATVHDYDMEEDRSPAGSSPRPLSL